MILSAQSIVQAGIVTPLTTRMVDLNGNSFGLSACGYDVRLDQNVELQPGDFVLASTIEHFKIPINVAGVVHDKSSLARRGLAVQNTILEPGWRGYLTLELTNHYVNRIALRRGSAIAQVVFHVLDQPTSLPYDGKYQDQEAGPQPALEER